MRGGRPSEEQLRRNFEAVLVEVRNGHGVRTETGLDSRTEQALWVIARAQGGGTEEMIHNARTAFAGQLDGSNAEARRVELADTIAERAARQRPGSERPGRRR
ncbi:hypothetical protein [Nocardia acididurans]|uniref:hypothetical protein n=1 Tax=Nocardia acididurans TaxID=2802282 RepID=UPI0027DBD8AD|nr:hypothetical protein [Nocardia acididurans]